MVKFLVGGDEEVFFIHESILSARTDYFIDSLQKLKKEAHVKVVKLPEEDLKIFTLYVHLVYTDMIPYMIEDDKKKDWSCRLDDDRGLHISCDEEYNALCELYAFAEKIEDAKTQIATITALAEKIEGSIDHEQCAVLSFCFPPVESINIMYNKTRPGSAGQLLLSHTYARHSDKLDNPLPKVDSVPAMFLWDVAEAATEIRTYDKDCDEMDLQWYHEQIIDSIRRTEHDTAKLQQQIFVGHLN